MKSAGYRAFLDLDLHTITFFMTAIAELAALAILGPRDVFLLAQEFHNDFIEGDGTLWDVTSFHPLNVRFAIYAHTGRLGGLAWRPSLPPTRIALELL